MAMGTIRSYLACIEAGYSGDLSNREAVFEERLVKRRRRNSSVSVSCNSQQIEQITGQNSAAVTTKRSSRFRGVSRHKWTGRYEAHLWDKLSWNTTCKKTGKQVYLGAYDDEVAAARAYDLAALKYWGASTFTNFPISDYGQELEIMQTVTKEEYIASLRRSSSGFSREVSKYRGLARHHHNGRWEARIGRVFGNKYLYLGIYGTQEEEAHAYNIAAIDYKGINAATSFDLSTYIPRLKPEPTNLFTAEETIPSTQSEHASLTFTAGKELKLACLQTKVYQPNDLTREDTYGRKNEKKAHKKSSSPTALDLLFKSSVFKELVQKNSSITGEGSSDKNINYMQKASNNDGYGFYNMPIWGIIPIC